MLAESEKIVCYALHNNELVHISKVRNGLNCNCICPHCKTALIAKNNPQNIKLPHFAHYNVECSFAYETTLHLLAKSLLQKMKKIKTPNFHFDYKPNNKKSVFSKGVIIDFDEIHLEKKVLVGKSYIIADTVGTKKSTKLLIEFAVTHLIDDLKNP